MLVLRHRLVIAGVIAAAAVTVPAAAFASGSGSPPGKPTPPQACAASACKSKAGNAAASIAAFAASAGVSPATAQRIVPTVFGTQADRGQTGEAAIAAALASQLGVSTSAAQRAVNQLDALGEGGVDPASSAFAAIARDLGVSPTQLAAALRAAKQSQAGK